nr:hypothetical protein [Chroococcidiopsis sp. [FACHB-1243]]
MPALRSDPIGRTEQRSPAPTPLVPRDSADETEIRLAGQVGDRSF